ncbi:putative fatty acyl-CoA reductase CG5065 isoform X2 [Cimex lectularius]|nr:putative fatty acyl-CoA reductase CG5065 isoform X2 [Cimex lectularius]XP_014251356.1 putative fatty acyl-CoA reductase CG5065 isoform X2 [Cimex lectularius]
MDNIPTFYYKPLEVPKEFQYLPDRISEYLNGKTLFITGGSGFLGKVLIEKILRKAPNVTKIYMLMRSKKGKDAKQRIEELFNSVVFSLLKKQHGNKIVEKVVPIAGDVSQANLGISPEDRKLLHDSVEVVFHAAATIRFDEPLKKAVLLNTRGTKYMIELAEEMKKLEVFLHISTAYCQLDQKVLEETLYSCPNDPHKIIKSCELMDEELVDKVSEKILKEFPNSYAFTKNLSESLISDAINKGMPIIVLRPSIVIPTWLEPIPGWTDNINGPTGLLIGAGKGVIRTMYCDNSGYADYMPVDICVNGILIALLNYAVFGNKHLKVYNVCSNEEWKITWQQIIDVGKDIITNEVPLNNAVWYPGGSMKRSRFLHNICVILFHMLPAYFIDSLIYLAGHKPVLLRVQDRINKGFEVFEYYANNQWDFKNDNLRNLRNVLNEREKLEYCINGTSMDMRLYFRDCILAARSYILKEPPETIPGARRHMRMMYWVDVLTRIAFLFFIFWFFMSSAGPLYNFGQTVYNLICHILSFFTTDSTVQSLKNEV